MSERLRVGIVGAGKIGAKRAREVARAAGSRLVAVVDADAARACELAREYSCRSGTDWESLVSGREVDAIIVATTHRWLARVSLAALESAKHVLCEKPLARNAAEARPVVAAAARNGARLMTGFNHRFHPALAMAQQMLSRDEIGRPLWIRCRYGHGGRPGYEREWRANPEESGGGELLDQGIHALDLFRWFLGDFAEVSATLASSFWPMAVEDNAFCTLRTAGGEVAQLHASWTQWKNLFSFELAGERGYLLAEGLGGSYGDERLVIGLRAAEGGAPREGVMTFDAHDVSWEREWREFLAAIREERPPLGDGEDGLAALRLVEAAYASARERRAVSLRTKPASAGGKEEHAEPRLHRAVS
ncbi:MAG TPA: Gfo/Idh/MocA family oxidoreductase [Candidatus Acidoferrales bacterium]|nr:Gfo/Idh/MocA family oxidoreductase [Candidatus Acidoferrales bacterium]